jgi:hypothetical protein
MEDQQDKMVNEQRHLGILFQNNFQMVPHRVEVHLMSNQHLPLLLLLLGPPAVHINQRPVGDSQPTAVNLKLKLIKKTVTIIHRNFFSIKNLYSKTYSKNK